MRNNLFKTFIIFVFLSINVFSQSMTERKNSLQISESTPPISVTIGGEFILNGTITAISGERVDQFITRVYNEYKLAMFNTATDRSSLDLIQRQIQEYALRDIKLLRINGDSLNLDLKKFRFTGNFEHNPYLMNDDVLIFPSLDMDRNFVEVSGAVNATDKTNIWDPQPIKFQFVEGDKLSDAILYAGGINSVYDSVKYALISRLSSDGKTENKIKVKIDEEFYLKPGDRVRVLADETYKKNYKVYIEGEVQQPGFIYITKDQTTLKDVIEKTGGFTVDADLNRAELIRGGRAFTLYFSEESDLLMMQRMSNISLEDSLSFIVDNKLRFQRGTSVIDFNNLNDSTSPSANFIMKDGDFIRIPEKLDLVYVYGQVLNPGYVEFTENQSYQYYIDRAGGLGLTARGDIYLIKGKTRAWILVEEDQENQVTIEAGDFIWAAKEPYRDFDYYLTRIGNVAAIVGSVATVLLLFLQAFK